MTKLNPPIYDVGQISGEPDFNTPNFKYAPLEIVLRQTNTFIGGVLEEMAKTCTGLVDIKVHHLKAGDYPCQPVWHLDGPSSEISDYCICVFGETLTEFMTTQFECDKYHQSKNPQNYESIFVKSGHIYHYTNRNVHRCSMCTKDETRLLVRMTNAKLTPQGRFTPGVYHASTSRRNQTHVKSGSLIFGG